MKTRLLTLALAGVITLTGSFTAQASPKKETTPAPDATDTAPSPLPSHPLPFNGKIFAVDPAARTFSTQNKEKKIRVFAITPQTKLTKKSGAATFEDLKIGDEVRGSSIPKGDGNYETESVIIGAREEIKPAPTAAPAPSATPSGSKSTPKPAKKPRTPTPTPTPGKTD